MAAAYLFFNYNCIFAYEISFSDTRKLYSIYGSNQPLWKIHGSALINFDCFAIDKSNQVKIFRVIMRSQGYFPKIALGTRLDYFSFSHFFRHFVLFLEEKTKSIRFCTEFYVKAAIVLRSKCTSLLPRNKTVQRN